MDNYGMRIRLVLKPPYSSSETLRNVTEIHYNYSQPLKEQRIAFESDIHGTGITYNVEHVAEFETRPETEIADEF